MNARALAKCDSLAQDDTIKDIDSRINTNPTLSPFRVIV